MVADSFDQYPRDGYPLHLPRSYLNILPIGKSRHSDKYYVVCYTGSHAHDRCTNAMDADVVDEYLTRIRATHGTTTTEDDEVRIFTVHVYPRGPEIWEYRTREDAANAANSPSCAYAAPNSDWSLT